MSVIMSSKRNQMYNNVNYALFALLWIDSLNVYKKWVVKRDFKYTGSLKRICEIFGIFGLKMRMKTT